MSDPNNAAVEFAKSISELATKSIQDAIYQTDVKCNTLIAEVNDKLSKIKNNIMAVKINDLPERKLTKRASKYLPLALKRAAVREWSLLVGPAGCGKGVIAEQVAESLDLPFSSIVFGQDTSITWIFGRQTVNGFEESDIIKKYRDGGVVFFDEYDNSNSNVMVACNSLTDPNCWQIYNPMNSEIVKRHADFILIAAANTNGKGANHVYTGRERQDAAGLDRFIPMAVDYDEELENELLAHDDYKSFLFNTRKELRKAHCAEVLSSRQFVKAQKQFSIGIDAEDIYNSTVFYWSDAAKEIARREFNNYDFTVKPQKLLEPAPVKENAEPSEVKRARGRPPGKYGSYNKQENDEEIAKEIARLKAENAILNQIPF